MSESARIVDALTLRLAQEGVRYCHWKSNVSLDNALAGREDVDLLVERSQLADMARVLGVLGFKAARSFSPCPPGIHHYYGLDAETGALIHVHLFSRLLTGESLVKSHQLPLAAMLLDSARTVGSIKVVSRTAELVLFVLRTFIKYGSPADLLLMMRAHASVSSELAWLRQEADADEAVGLLQAHCPQVEATLFRRCLESLDRDTSFLQRYRLARRVRRRLRVHAAHSAWSRRLEYGRWLWWFAVRRLTGRKDKVLAAGGAVIAIVGPEATGKSTLIEESRAWLASAFAASAVHAGKPPASWLTWPVNLALPYLRELFPRFRRSRVEGHVRETLEAEDAAPPRDGWTGLFYALRVVSVAWDRRRLLMRARRAAARGQIVLCDRYPSLVVGAMDSPRLAEVTGRGPLASLLRHLARLEARLYRDMPPPDLILRLHVSLETAKRRNRERLKLEKEGEAYLISRHRQASEWQRPGVRTCDIDTERPLRETILAVKQAIWSEL